MHVPQGICEHFFVAIRVTLRNIDMEQLEPDDYTFITDEVQPVLNAAKEKSTEYVWYKSHKKKLEQLEFRGRKHIQPRDVGAYFFLPNIFQSS